MNREIEELAHNMCEYYYEGTCYLDKMLCDCKCATFTDAQNLYWRGYRKSTDVARKIFAELEQKRNEYWNKGKYTMLDCWCNAEEDVRKKYESEEAE